MCGIEKHGSLETNIGRPPDPYSLESVLEIFCFYLYPLYYSSKYGRGCSSRIPTDAEKH